MLTSQGFNPKADVSQLPKLGKAYLIPGKEAPIASTDKALNWKIEKEKNGETKVSALPNIADVYVTSVAVRSTEVAVPKELNIYGYKIDLKGKIESYKEKYAKNFALTRSHNLMVSLFARVKSAFYGELLRTLGVPQEEIKGLQKHALDGLKRQNMALFVENEYNNELLAIVGGGSRKQVKQQQRITGEIRTQLVTQGKNLGMADQYSQVKVLETQLEQCRNIREKFVEERNNLKYQLAYLGAA